VGTPKPPPRVAQPRRGPSRNGCPSPHSSPASERARRPSLPAPAWLHALLAGHQVVCHRMPDMRYHYPPAAHEQDWVGPLPLPCSTRRGIILHPQHRAAQQLRFPAPTRALTRSPAAGSTSPAAQSRERACSPATATHLGRAAGPFGHSPSSCPGDCQGRACGHTARSSRPLTSLGAARDHWRDPAQPAHTATRVPPCALPATPRGPHGCSAGRSYVGNTSPRWSIYLSPASRHLRRVSAGARRRT
jgi:hypothetical protein